MRGCLLYVWTQFCCHRRAREDARLGVDVSDTKAMFRDPKLLVALAAYAVLAIAAWRTLDAEILWVTWIVLGAFAIKTVLVALKSRMD